MTNNSSALEPLTVSGRCYGEWAIRPGLRTLHSKAVRGLELAATMWSTLQASPADRSDEGSYDVVLIVCRGRDSEALIG
jgi:hypothetical protein